MSYFLSAVKGTLAAATVVTGLVSNAIAAPEVTPLVSTDWLASNLGSDEIVVLDTRSKISKSGKEDYLKGHIPGAVWSEYPGYWRTERNGVVGVLPSVEKLEAALSEIGVSEDKAVVIVPHGKDSLEFGSAARIYWTFKYLGHEAVTILDGGHAAWVAENRPLETGNVVPEGDMFVAEINEDLLISTDEVASAVGSDAVLLDGRPLKQFVGQEKHKKATRFGHIPGAVNLDQANFYDKTTNRLKSKDQIASLIPASLKSADAPVVSYCNTGHWAATNWFVLSELSGHKNVTLYDESMVGWTRQADLPIKATEQPAPLATN
ncbi:thiosulfate sulfurtransferase [Roseibium sp. TrichSKD4]|uniref:sulfurtransferase n=1 Tax=Roseibium sp. TrichSKD4 TaxID=744980 RepID=UPI0001E57021|nr:sulfurtransferase [Roseibium sp. TrichSKD4]EFO30448.1 thiosulfate sulfurtransferase [Roseibium sp. TrichSKD4]